MKLYKYVMLTILCGATLLAPSCTTLRRLFGEVERNFPSAVSSVAHGALNESEAIIKSVGQHKIEPKDVTLKLIPGERRLGGQWAFQDPRLPGMWVYGVTNATGKEVILPHAPGNIADINVGTLTHEFAHHWLHSNGHRVYHHPAYDGKFTNWANARRIAGRSVPNLAIEVLAIEYLENVSALGYDTGLPIIAVTFLDAADELCVAHGVYIEEPESARDS